MRFTMGAIFLVRVPATIMRSACLGEGLKTSDPKREISHVAELVTIISRAHQAKPKVTGQIEYFRPQFTTQSRTGRKGVFSRAVSIPIPALLFSRYRDRQSVECR